MRDPCAQRVQEISDDKNHQQWANEVREAVDQERKNTENDQPDQ